MEEEARHAAEGRRGKGEDAWRRADARWKKPPSCGVCVCVCVCVCVVRLVLRNGALFHESCYATTPCSTNRNSTGHRFLYAHDSWAFIHPFPFIINIQ